MTVTVSMCIVLCFVCRSWSIGIGLELEGAGLCLAWSWSWRACLELQDCFDSVEFTSTPHHTSKKALHDINLHCMHYGHGDTVI